MKNPIIDRKLLVENEQLQIYEGTPERQFASD